MVGGEEFNVSLTDCLTINVQRPAGTAANAKLPVLVWIYGGTLTLDSGGRVCADDPEIGGFELGSTNMYDGTPVVTRAVSNGLPLVYVSMNYRLAGTS